MSKKTSLFLGILGVVLIIGCFWYTKNKKGQLAKNNQHAIQEQNNQENNQKKEEKNEGQLVWYEVPELGIRFKVSPDTKDDLKYFIDGSSTYLYYQSVIDFARLYDNNCKLLTKECTEGSLGLISIKDNSKAKENTGMPLCRDNEVVATAEENIICFVHSQAPILAKNQYDKYLESVKKKQFSLNLETAELIAK
jgi:hypothetical protein